MLITGKLNSGQIHWFKYSLKQIGKGAPADGIDPHPTRRASLDLQLCRNAVQMCPIETSEADNLIDAIHAWISYLSHLFDRRSTSVKASQCSWTVTVL